MTLPGFNAETSLYKTSIHYRFMGALVQADGVIPQLFSCGPCFTDATGACLRNCTEPCDPSACQPQCCRPGFHCCGDCLPGNCVPVPFSNQGCVPLGVRCR